MIKSYKPVTPGMRSKKTLVRNTTTGNVSRPEKSLTRTLKSAPGRSNGRISIRHREGGNKKFYRVIDFARNKRDIPAKVATIEYDPNRGPSIALLHYTDGEKRYILAPEGLEVGMSLMSGDAVELKVGNALPLSKIPLGTAIHNIELNPGQGGTMARGAGNSAMMLAKEGAYVNIKLPSGEVKKFLGTCYATVGVLSNMDLRNTRLGKAGIQRHLGNRPHVRGVAMANPSDHPHAGSYRDNGIGMPAPKSPWGWTTRGRKTRHRKNTNVYLVKDRRIK
ncbi:50S ribosomal protein L2 [candidate division WWE3 bacterium]|nr:50S ribosomal protein L2 [candidate division WWE3 bacterium]